ncbi:MAG: hypothetical protein ACLQU5_33545 [Isosphaeraceae bacterium]
MPSIGDAVAQIVAAGLPILFIDTCILLDVIRAPLRPAQPRDQGTLNPPRVRQVVPPGNLRLAARLDLRVAAGGSIGPWRCSTEASIRIQALKG